MGRKRFGQKTSHGHEAACELAASSTKTRRNKFSVVETVKTRLGQNDGTRPQDAQRLPRHSRFWSTCGFCSWSLSAATGYSGHVSRVGAGGSRTIWKGMPED